MKIENTYPSSLKLKQTLYAGDNNSYSYMYDDEDDEGWMNDEPNQNSS